MSKATKLTLVILFVLIILSLSLNGVLLWRWWRFQQQVDGITREMAPALHESLTQALRDLESFEQSTIELNVHITEEFPVQMEVPFQGMVEVPVQLTVPITQEIQTTVLIDPLQTGLNIPTDVVIPLDLEVPIDLNIPVSIDQTIPISTTVPVDVTVPLAIKVSETNLGPYVEQLRTGLTPFVQMLSDIE